MSKQSTPPGTAVESVTPAEINVGDWVFMGGAMVARVRKVTTDDAGGYTWFSVYVGQYTSTPMVRRADSEVDRLRAKETP